MNCTYISTIYELRQLSGHVQGNCHRNYSSLQLFKVDCGKPVIKCYQYTNFRCIFKDHL